MIRGAFGVLCEGSARFSLRRSDGIKFGICDISSAIVVTASCILSTDVIMDFNSELDNYFQ